MKTLAKALLAVVLMIIGPSIASAHSVLISEMCDPHLEYTTDRFIEIYNAGAVAVDLAGWSLVAVGNGGNIFTWSLNGTIDPGDALVAGDATTVTVFQVDFPDEAWSVSNGLWNGKIGDGAKLVDATATVIDYAVVAGTAFENQDYVRNYGVVAPNTVYTPSEWTATPVEYATDASPGSHSTVPPVPGPTVSGIITDPAIPLAGLDINVQADVSDSIAAVTTVTLFWGTSSSSLPNTIVMSVLSGSTYRTDTPIPSQSEGTTVYFRIEAWSNVPAVTLTDLQSYAVPYDVTIAEIQGAAAASPYDTDTVITHGVVTGVYGSAFTLQDGTGAWNGMWAQGVQAVSVGDSLVVYGRVTESAGLGYAGNTLLADAVIAVIVPGAALPAPAVGSTTSLPAEQYEGVLVSVNDAVCTNQAAGHGEWIVNDGSGAGTVDDLACDITPTLGTTYDVTGVLTYSYSAFKLEPRDCADVVWAGDESAPVVFYASVASDTTVLVTFSEEVEETSAEMGTNYLIAGLVVRVASRDAGHPDQVLLTVSAMSVQEYVLAVDGVLDLYGNAAAGAGYTFRFVDNSAPAGYYDSAQGLAGDALKAALHNIIRNHTPSSYDYAWTAYRTTDDKPNGRVWDIYSDVPGGTAPYEYWFGVDEGGIGGQEGEGYTREHAWPKSWFGGEVSPMYSDLFALYPCDAHVNGNRGNYPYGEVGLSEWTSENGSERGVCSYPGYSGIVFEPIDAFKGDVARTYLYFSTRYYTEDAAWPGSPMTDGAELLPWAASMLLEWHAEDPVSQKEIDRNGAVYEIQQNRNPFIDHPEYAALVFTGTGVDDESSEQAFALRQNVPNPFNPVTTISFEVPEGAAAARLAVYSVSGTAVREWTWRSPAAGVQQVTWDSTDGNGRRVASGVYFYRLEVDGRSALKKMVVLK